MWFRHKTPMTLEDQIRHLIWLAPHSFRDRTDALDYLFIQLNFFEKNFYVALNHRPRKSEGAFRVLFDNGIRRGNTNNNITASSLIAALEKGIVVLAEFPESLP